jgi:predicted N-acetyltransferase YhbS
LTSRYGLEIRAATAGDAAGLSELLGSNGHAIAPRILADRLDTIRQDQGAVLIALEWGPPSGVVVLHWYRTLDAPQPIAQVTMLLVGVDERRRGVGRLLIKAGSQAARVAGCGALELLVPPEQTGLAAFCMATGFAEAGSRFSRPLRKGLKTE